MTVGMIGTAFVAAFIGGNMCVLTSLMCPDEKAALSIFTLASVVFMLLIYGVNKFAQIGSREFLAKMTVLGVAVTFFNVYLLEKRVDLITKP